MYKRIISIVIEVGDDVKVGNVLLPLHDRLRFVTVCLHFLPLHDGLRFLPLHDELRFVVCPTDIVFTLFVQK